MPATLFLGRIPGPALDWVITGVLVGTDVGWTEVLVGSDEELDVGVGLELELCVTVAGIGGDDVIVALGSRVGLKSAVIVKSGVGNTNGVGADIPGKLQARPDKIKITKGIRSLGNGVFTAPPDWNFQ